MSVRRVNRKWGQVFVPKCGWVKFRVTREWSDIETASSARVTLDHSGRWFVSFTRLAPQIERKSTGAIVGIDMGIAITVATSEGKSLKAPKSLTKGQRQRKRRLQRRLARQVKGSNRYRVTKLAIAKLAAKEVDRRKDWIEWTTTDLVRDYDLISLEDLKITNMTKCQGNQRQAWQER
ncbi:RNA-guided endonuclease TnpB family protein [Ferrimicrobium acidiphilum]|uniref:RNA-guided endonuclease TnpB family protein n=1 Tax=Ferrimicrobium acidiphilum TaxID=121039 RepID=UPI003C6CF9AF